MYLKLGTMSFIHHKARTVCLPRSMVHCSSGKKHGALDITGF
ncbi:hypothetical protein SLEP1_g6186 [Rubroshorea leprosula]|uniref:Uncharacterized protein n=1 Tax=Rubroshorea leprosula TaxID=152421 RepID=A0AAV5I0C1_9ROSI|nr:hypothetical protein SLEP1_g6186 [Rubroshorea leprosula]